MEKKRRNELIDDRISVNTNDNKKNKKTKKSKKLKTKKEDHNKSIKDRKKKTDESSIINKHLKQDKRETDEPLVVNRFLKQDKKNDKDSSILDKHPKQDKKSDNDSSVLDKHLKQNKKRNEVSPTLDKSLKRDKKKNGDLLNLDKPFKSDKKKNEDLPLVDKSLKPDKKKRKTKLEDDLSEFSTDIEGGSHLIIRQESSDINCSNLVPEDDEENKKEIIIASKEKFEEWKRINYLNEDQFILAYTTDNTKLYNTTETDFIQSIDQETVQKIKDEGLLEFLSSDEDINSNKNTSQIFLKNKDSKDEVIETLLKGEVSIDNTLSNTSENTPIDTFSKSIPEDNQQKKEKKKKRKQFRDDVLSTNKEAFNEEISKFYKNDQIIEINNLTKKFQIDFQNSIVSNKAFMTYINDEITRGKFYIEDLLKKHPFIERIKKGLEGFSILKELFTPEDKVSSNQGTKILGDFLRQKSIESINNNSSEPKLQYQGDKSKISSLLSKLKEHGIGFDLEECSREYCKRFMREKMLSYERDCRNKEECICMILPIIYPDNVEVAINRTDTFICREFLTPSQDVLARRGYIESIPNNLCLLCTRFKISTNIWINASKNKDADFILQNHYNKISGADGYNIDKCEWVFILNKNSTFYNKKKSLLLPRIEHGMV